VHDITRRYLHSYLQQGPGWEGAAHVCGRRLAEGRGRSRNRLEVHSQSGVRV